MLFAAIPYCYLFYLVAVCVFELYVVIMSRFLNSAVWGNIKDKWIVISGATDGIGKEIALQLAEKGQKLLVLGRNEEKLRNLKEEIDKITKKEDICQTAVFDFSHENDFSTLPDVPIGMLINNAGVSADHPEFFYDEPRMTDIITVNNINLLKLTKHCVPRMGENTYLINIGSGLADTVAPLMATYSASKAFVKHFSHSIHFELLQKKIFCQYVAPNMVSTKMSKCKPSFFSPSAKTFAEAFIKSIGAHYTISPYIPHVLQNILLKFIPSNVLGTLMFGAMSKTRTKALEKKAKND